MSAPATKTNGWIAVPINGDIEAAIGQKFDIKSIEGPEAYGLIFGRPSKFVWSDGVVGIYLAQHGPDFSCNFGDDPDDIIAYRLHEPEDTAEQARRAARIDIFRKIAETAPIDSSRPEPEREVLFRRREVLNPPSGLAHVSVGLRQCVIGLAYRARAFWSRRLADDLTPAQRAEAHTFIRELTAIIADNDARHKSEWPKP